MPKCERKTPWRLRDTGKHTRRGPAVCCIGGGSVWAVSQNKGNLLGVKKKSYQALVIDRQGRGEAFIVFALD